MRDSEEYDRFHGAFPLPGLLSHAPHTYRKLLTIWISASVLLVISGLIVFVVGARGIPLIPGSGEWMSEVLHFSKILIPSLAAIETKQEWVSNGNMATSLQALLLSGWIVTLVSSLVFWRVVRSIDRTDWVEFYRKLQACPQKDLLYIGSPFFIILLLSYLYFGFLISVFGASWMTPIAIGVFFALLIYFAQTFALLLLAKAYGKKAMTTQ